MRYARPTGTGLLAASAAALMLAACGTPRVAPPAPQVPEEVLEHPSQARERLRPMPVRPLDVQAECRFTDAAGYKVDASVDIRQSDVRAFSARIDVPRRGACRFDLADFRQVRKAPNVELRAADGCSVLVWEQGDQVTVGFSRCASRCDRGTFDYVWPLLVDRPSGRCS
ncbi:hypothetical protein [Pseudothauera nasutitermitis]|nr:hypothetical protein [Pseudothauera nasutitermitis]